MRDFWRDRDWGAARNIMIRALRGGSFALAISSETIVILSEVFVQSCTA
jgi:putative transposase